MYPENLKAGYDYFTKVIVPKQEELATEVSALNKKWKLFDMDKIHPGIVTKYLSRQRIGEDDVPRGEDPVTGQDMSGWNPSVARRDFKTAIQVGMEDGKPLKGAQPILIKDQGDGNATQWQNKQPAKFKYDTDEDTPNLRNVGTFFTDDNGKRWVVDHADAQHIEDQGIVNPRTGQPLEYNKNPVTASMISMEGLTKARDTMRLLDDIKNDPKYADNFLGANEANEKEAIDKWGGLYKTNLEQFKNKFMSQPTAQALNDFRKPGLAMPNALTAAANGLIKTMYVPGFPIHGLNVAAQWFIGKPWANTQAWRGLLEDFPTALKDVNSQGDIQHEIREAGGSTQLSSVLTDQARNDIFRHAGQEMVKFNKFWKPFADKFGTTVPQLAQDVYDWSRKELWRMNDTLYTQQYMTFKRMGLSPEDAVKRTEDFITNYRLNNKVMGQRWLANLYNTPALSLFGRYHQGLWNSWQKVASGLTPGADPDDRKKAAVAIIAMGVLGFFVKPYILDPLAQTVTGNPNAEFGPRGMLTIPSQLRKIATGEQGYEAAVPNVFIRDYLAADIEGQELVADQVFTGRVDKTGKHGSVEWAICWLADADGFVHSYCNTIPTPDGGTREIGSPDRLAAWSERPCGSDRPKQARGRAHDRRRDGELRRTDFDLHPRAGVPGPEQGPSADRRRRATGRGRGARRLRPLACGGAEPGGQAPRLGNRARRGAHPPADGKRGRPQDSGAQA